MSQLSRATFDTTYVNAAGTFADNSTRDISEGDMRQYADDVIDSCVTKNDDYDFWFKKTTASGTDTYTITDTVPTGYASDEKWLISFTNSNTGAATLNRNSLGAKGLKSATGGALSAGDIVAGGYYLVIYNGTEYRVLNAVAASGSLSGLTSPRIPYATSATTLGDDSALSWDATNNAINLGDARIHTTGTASNIFFGETAGNFTNTGSRNVGLGNDCLIGLTTGLANIVIGDSGQSISSASSNVIVGTTSGNLCTGGSNVIVGASAATALTSGTNNTSLGLGACSGLTQGSYCVGIGYNTNVGTTGSNNVSIGKQSQIITATSSNQLSIQNAIYGDANSATGTTISSGNIGFFANTWGTSAARVVSIGIGTAPSTAITDGIQVFAKNSSDGTANATLGLYLEQTVEAIGTFTASHKLKIWINGTEYWIQLDAV